MSASTGDGDFPVRSRMVRMAGMRPQHTAPTMSSPLGTALSDFLFGLPPARVFDIPYSWISPPVVARPDLPTNDFTASSTSGGRARATNTDSIDDYGVYADSRELDTAVDADPSNLATHMVATYSDPRVRISLLRLTLTPRTELEKHTILSVDIGARIEITDSPITWPVGAHKLTVEGVKHIVEQDDRIVEWRTSPMIGVIDGEVGPWFQLDVSSLSGSHKLAY